MWKGSSSLRDMLVTDINLEEAERLVGDHSDARAAVEALFDHMRDAMSTLRSLMLFVVEGEAVAGFVEVTMDAEGFVWRGPYGRRHSFGKETT